MTDPVNTDALRTWAAARADNKLLPLVLAAADELDRLRATIENTPHDSGCQFSFLPADKPRRCTCWKADAP